MVDREQRSCPRHDEVVALEERFKALKEQGQDHENRLRGVEAWIQKSKPYVNLLASLLGGGMVAGLQAVLNGTGG